MAIGAVLTKVGRYLVSVDGVNIHALRSAVISAAESKLDIRDCAHPRDRATCNVRPQQLDEDFTRDSSRLERDVVAVDQICTFA